MDSSGKKLGRPQTKALQSEEEDSRAGDEQQSESDQTLPKKVVQTQRKPQSI